MSLVFDYKDLITFASDTLLTSSLSPQRSQIIAETLVASDLMGHTTHGLQLLAPYMDELTSGTMSISGEPTVIRDHNSAVTWHGHHLPGPYLMHAAMELGFKRIKSHPVFTLSIQQSHHIACLAAYMQKATDRNLMMILFSSDPMNKTVAPFGGLDGVYSPDPIAYGIPTEGDPIIFDSSASTVANGVVNQHHKLGKDLDGEWMMDAQGKPTNKTEAFYEDPPATILPVGGMDLGFKGFGLAILIEALTSGLSGYGRRGRPQRWGSSIQMQLIDPAQFGGLEPFKAEMQFLADQCRKSRPRTGFSEVRMPGSRALQKKREQIKSGLALHPVVWEGLKACSSKYGIALPKPLATR